MACRILRAPAQSLLQHFKNSNQIGRQSLRSKAKLLGLAGQIQSRNYNNYVTHGELAELKEPSDYRSYEEEAEYAEILDMSEEGIARRKRQEHYDEVLAMPTAHHKMYLINNYYWRGEMYYIGDLHYNSLNVYQYATRTCLKTEEPSPENAQETSQLDPGLVSSIEEILLAHTLVSTSSPTDEEKNLTNLLRSITDAIRYNAKLEDISAIEQPRIEAAWQHSNFKTNNDEERFEEKTEFAPWFQFAQNPLFMLSSDIPLKPIVEPTSEAVEGSDFPVYNFYPELMGMVCKKHWFVNTPGYWCEASQYPLLTVASMKKVFPSSLDPAVGTDHLNESERRKRLTAHGLMANFASAVSSATNCGFTVFHEITYPFVAQHIVTDGQNWHFSKYQLNTMSFGPDFPTQKQNLAWSSEEMKLYDSIEDGKIIGLNTRVLSRIVETVKASREMVENPRPYTSTDVDREFIKRGVFLNKSDASRRYLEIVHQELEIPLWAKIYKMNKDAPPTPLLKWERPKQRNQHIYQFDKVLWDNEMQRVKEYYQRMGREKLMGQRAMGVAYDQTTDNGPLSDIQVTKA